MALTKPARLTQLSHPDALNCRNHIAPLRANVGALTASIRGTRSAHPCPSTAYKRPTEPPPANSQKRFLIQRELEKNARLFSYNKLKRTYVPC